VLSTDLHLQPNEASDLCPVLDEARLAARGWDRAFVTVLDEATAEEAVAVLGHDAGAGPEDGWHAVRLRLRPDRDAGRTDDAEACARRGDQLWLIGSQFGKKSGPLDPRRSWVGRLAQDDVDAAIDGATAPLELRRLRFGLHRAINDALRAASVELIPLGDRARAAYIDATITLGAERAKRWAGRVTSADRPVNVEAAAFRRDGRLLLGLRYPTTVDGHPLLVELEDPDRLFDAPDEAPRASAVWVLADVGTADAPAGVRALHGDGRDRFDAVVGDLDAAGKGATILEDHPEGAVAPSRHIRFDLPLTARGGDVTTRRLHDFGDVRRVEGIALGPDGHAHFVLDEEGAVCLRTLVVEDDRAPTG